MGKTEILEALYNGKNFRECIERVAPEDLRDDLRQEIILRLCEQDDSKIIGLHERGELEFYTVRVIINEIRGKSNGFAKKYRTNYVELTEREIAEEPDVPDRELKEQLEDFTLSEIDSLYWYDSEMIKLYMRIGTFRGIQDLTGIPHVSCFKTIKKAMATLKRRATIELAARPKPLFTRQETQQIAGHPPLNLNAIRNAQKNIR